MKWRRGKRLLSFLLTLAMILGMIPGMSLTAMAASGDGPLVGTVIKVGDTLTINAHVYFETAPGTIDVDDNDWVSTLKNISYNPAASVWEFGFDDGCFLVLGSEEPEPDGFEIVSGDGQSENTAYKLALYYEDVSVTLTGGRHATPDPEDGTTQTGVTGAMETVYYTADEGYYFPEFGETETNGIYVTWMSETEVMVSGTPTAPTVITVPDAVEPPVLEESRITVVPGENISYLDNKDLFTVRYNGSFQDVRYSIDNGHWKTLYDNEGTYNPNEAVERLEAGTYTVEWIAFANETFAEARGSFEITISEIEVIPPETALSLVYNGTEQQLITAAGSASKGTMLYAVTKEGETASEFTPNFTEVKETAAGNYYVWYKVVAYEEQFETELVAPQYIPVTIAEAEIGEYTAPTAAEGLVFDDTPQALIAQAGTVENGTMLYALTGSATEEPVSWTPYAEAIRGTDPGLYFVWYKIVLNNDDMTDPVMMAVRIEKADCPITIRPAEELVSGDSDPIFTMRRNGSGQTVLYSVDNSRWTDADEPIMTAEDLEPGTYTVEWKALEGQRFKAAEGSFEITVEEISVGAPDVAEGLVYNGEEQQLISYPGSTNRGRMQYAYTAEGAAPGDFVDDFTAAKAAGPGRYYVWYRVVDDEDAILVKPAYKTVVIADAEIGSFTAPEVAEGLVYNEKEQQLIAEPATAENGTVAYAVSEDETVPADEDWVTDPQFVTRTDPGDYYVWYKVTEGEMTLAEPCAIPVSIDKAKCPVSVSRTLGLVFNNEEQNLVRVNSDYDLEVLFSVNQGDWTDKAEAKDAGVYIIEWKAAETDLFKAGSGYVAGYIRKADQDIDNKPTAKQMRYTGEYQDLVDAPVSQMLPAGCELVYSLDGENWSAQIPFEREIGEYTVYFMVTGNKNYNESEVESVVSTISEAEAGEAHVLGADRTYDGATQPLVYPSYTENGTMMYRLAGEEEWSEEIPMAKDAGEYVVYYYIRGDEGYEDSPVGSILVTIAKRPVDIQVLDAAKISGDEEPEYKFKVVSELGKGDTVETVIGGRPARLPSDMQETQGEYPISFTDIEVINDNYILAEVEPGTLKIVRSGNAIVAFYTENWVYGEEAIRPEAVALYGDAHIQYLDGEEWKNWTASDHPVKAGTYEVRAVVDETESYGAAEEDGTVTIYKAVPDITVTPVDGLVYNDGHRMVSVLNKADEPLTIGFSLDGAEYDDIPRNREVKAGYHYIAWASMESGNYKAAKGYVLVYVDKETVIITEPAGKDLTYNGTEQQLTSGAAADRGYEVVYFIEGVSSDWGTAEETKAKDAGEYTVKYKVVSTRGGSIDLENYAFTDENGEEVARAGKFTSTIAQAEVTLEWENDEVYFITTATPVGPDVQVVGAIDGDEVEAVFDPGFPNKQVMPGTYVALVTGLTNKNYKLKSSAVTGQIFKVVLNVGDISVQAKDMTYGDNGTFAFVESEQYGILDESRFDITYYYAPEDSDVWEAWGPDSTTPAGIYKVRAVVKDPEKQVVFGTDPENTFEITRRKVTVRALDQWIDYGDTIDPLTDLSAEITGLTPEDEANIENVMKVLFDVGAQGDQPWEAGTYEITPVALFVYGYADNYEPETISGELHIAQAPENRIEMEVEDHIYGDTVVKPAATAQYGTPEVVWLPYDEYTGSDDDAWNEWTGDLRPVNAGSYVVKAFVEGAQSYPAGETIKSFRILKRPAVIEIKDGSSVYDGNEVQIQDSWYVESNLVQGDELVYEKVSVPSPIKEVGTYKLTAEYGEFDNPNYVLLVFDGTYEVTPKKMTEGVDYTVDDSDAHAVFDGNRHGIRVEVSEDIDAVVYYSREKLEDPTEGYTNPDFASPVHAGKYVVWYYIVSDDYATVEGSAIVVIDRAYLRVKVADYDVEYGTRINYVDEDYSYEEAVAKGFITVKAYKDRAETEEEELIEEVIGGMEDFELIMGEGYTNEMSEVGTYLVTCTGLTSSDYIIRYEDGMVTVCQKLVRIAWDQKDGVEFTYNGQEQGVAAVPDKDDLVGTDKIEGQVRVVALNTSATEVKRDADWNVESYKAKAQSLAGPRSRNYKIDWEDDSVELEYKIVPVNITVKPDDVTAAYGGKAVPKGYTARVLVNGEKAEDVLRGEPVYKFVGEDGSEYEAGKDAGSYSVEFDTANFNKADGFRAQNYQLSALKGTLEVAKRSISLKWSTPATFEYDGQYHEVKVVKVNNGYQGQPAVTYVNNKEVNAGTYKAVAKLGAEDAKNYVITGGTEKYTWTITQRPVTVQANNKTILYGESASGNGITVKNKTRVKNVETGRLDKIGDVTYKYNYAKNGAPGTYTIRPVVSNVNPNYKIEKVVNGTLTVNYQMSTLLVEGRATGAGSVTLTWNKIKNAARYDVYFAICDSNGKHYTPVKIGTVKKNKFVKGGLLKNRFYKAYVIARDANGKAISVSEMVHVATNKWSGKYSNVKTITAAQDSITVKKGKSKKLAAATLTTWVEGKQVTGTAHSPRYRYVSSNPAVADVNSSGRVTGKSKGWCKIYIIAPNGVWDETEVFVK